MTVPLVPAAVLVGYAWATQPHAHERSFSGGDADSTLNAAEMYRRVRDGAGFNGLLEAKATVDSLAILYGDRADRIEGLRARMAESWTGSASESAFQYSQPFSDAMRDTRDTLAATSGHNGPFARQVDAYTQVLRDVQPLPDKPPQSDLLNTVNIFETDTDKAIKAYNNTAERNVAAYTTYYNSSGDNGKALPHTFPTPFGTTAPSVSVLPLAGQSSVRSFSAQVPVPGGSVGTTHAPPAAAASVSGGPAEPRVGDPAPGLTTRQSFTPVTPAVPTPVVGTPQPSSGGTGVPFGMVPGVGPGGEPGWAGGSAGGPGAGRPGGPGGSGARGSGGPGARGSGGMAEQVGRRGAPGMSSVERGVLPGERASASGVGGPGGAGRRKDGEEDKERGTKYVLSEDLDLGATEIVAPPVIGDNR
jgi:hypothetical protein